MVATPVEFQTVPTGADTDTTVPGIWNIPSEGRELAEGYGSIDLSPGENPQRDHLRHAVSVRPRGLVFEESETPFLAGINPLYRHHQRRRCQRGHNFLYRNQFFADWVSYGSPELITIRFRTRTSSGDASVITIPAEYYLTITCFAAGTDIATPTGSTAVEALQARRHDHDRPMARDNSRGLGCFRQTVSTVFCRNEPTACASCASRRAALGGGLPDRDLRVTADHAMLVGGMLIKRRVRW